MPDFQITSPDGRKFKWTGDRAPTAADITEFERGLGPAPKATSTPPPKVSAPSKGKSETFLNAAKETASGLVQQAKTGVSRVVAGAKVLDPVTQMRNRLAGKPTGAAATVKGARDMVEGALQTAEVPMMGLAAASAIVNPLETAAALGLGYVAARGTQVITKKLGASPDASALAGDVAGLLAPGATSLARPFRGGFASTPEAQARLALNEKFDLGLSAPEIATGTSAGHAGKQIQRAIGSTFTGGAVQAKQRAATDTKISTILDRTLSTIRDPLSSRGTGVVTGEGIKAAQAGLKVRGQQMEAIAKTEPPVNVTPVTDEATRVFVDEVAKHLEDFPGLSKGARKAIINARASGNYVQHTGDPYIPELLDAVKEHDQTPLMKVARMVLDAKPETSFEGAANARRELMEYAGYGAQPKRTPDEGLASKLGSMLTDTLFTASPAFKQASSQYGASRRIVHHDAVDSLFKLAASFPEQVISHVGLKDVSAARNLRQGMLDVASLDPAAAPHGHAAFDAFRTGWFRDQILRGGADKIDIAGMGARLRTATESGVARELFGDPPGRALITTTKSLAEAAETRPQTFQRSMYVIMALGGIVNLRGIGAASVAGAEASTGLLSWLAYRPEVARWFVEGSKAPTGSGAVLLKRVAQAYAADQATQKPNTTAIGQAPKTP